MTRIIVFNMLSVDGFYAGENGDISWHSVDADFNEFAIEQLKNEVGMLMFGRVTYDLMASYWPTEDGLRDNSIVAGLMNGVKKIVFSRSLEKTEWSNAELKKNIKIEEIGKLKEQINKDIFIFGSGQIVQEFAKLGLIDEYRLMINPVVLGSGKKLLERSLKLDLLKSKQFKNGNVLLNYSVKI